MSIPTWRERHPKVLPVDTDRMRFVSNGYKDGSEAQLFMFNGANEIDELRAALAAARAQERERIAEICYDNDCHRAVKLIRNLTDEPKDEKKDG